MAKIKHEITNRKVNVNKKYKENWNGGWISLDNRYHAKCSICNEYIAYGVKVMWNVKDKILMHKNDCTV